METWRECGQEGGRAKVSTSIVFQENAFYVSDQY